MNNYDLKRCPFCGGRAVIKFEERPDTPSRYWVFLVICSDCGARTKDFPTGNYYGMNYTPDDAAKAWDKRNANANHDFLKKVMQIAEESSADEEEYHSRTDDAMEELLIELGYGDAVAVIRSHGRWYS